VLLLVQKLDKIVKIALGRAFDVRVNHVK